MTRILAAVVAVVLVSPAVARAQDGLTVVRGTAPVDRAAANFTGIARVGDGFRAQAPARVYGATVAFEPGARTDWHLHALGQILVVTAGVGRVQEWGGPVREVRPGDVVQIPPGVKHWHGASPDSPMTHVGLVETPANGRSTTWMEPVTDEQYAARPVAPATADSAGRGHRSTAGRQIMGDIAPQLATLTDEVLFDQVWASPELSQRDRSLVTISALIALNRPDQLRSHLARARRNGVTREEAIAAITQLAFYAGWPSAVTAVGVAREVFEEERR